MKMYLGSLLLLIGFYSFAQDGKLKREMNPFSSVNVRGSIDLVFIPSNSSFVEIVGKNPQDILTDVEDGVLQILHKKGKNWVSSEWNTVGKGLQVFVHAPTVNSISTAGSGNILIEGILKSNELKLRVDGSGNLNGHINVGDFSLEHNGSSNIRLKGSVEKAVINSSGSGNIQSVDLMIDDCTLSKSGSGNAQITVNVNLQASISGSGNFTYRGNPKKITTSSAGTGKIKQAQ